MFKDDCWKTTNNPWNRRCLGALKQENFTSSGDEPDLWWHFDGLVQETRNCSVLATKFPLTHKLGVANLRTNSETSVLRSHQNHQWTDSMKTLSIHTNIRIVIMKTKSWDHLTFIMEIPVLVEMTFSCWTSTQFSHLKQMNWMNLMIMIWSHSHFFLTKWHTVMNTTVPLTPMAMHLNGNIWAVEFH